MVAQSSPPIEAISFLVEGRHRSLFPLVTRQEEFAPVTKCVCLGRDLFLDWIPLPVQVFTFFFNPERDGEVQNSGCSFRQILFFAALVVFFLIWAVAPAFLRVNFALAL